MLVFADVANFAGTCHHSPPVALTTCASVLQDLLQNIALHGNGMQVEQLLAVPRTAAMAHI